ncbi:eIF-2-alpha kinase activator GCN1 [Hypsibius exemplaris]|uniref:EIF-2-alpha kinase activator GCN1 n=1 Tax=Hypsibius exemplaris TaxID=2072580 RepID=A0A1W0X456_HYPEX|nr:eIF-2-alpha kinase activator GCN1 [Hypsibius exemplaris]
MGSAGDSPSAGAATTTGKPQISSEFQESLKNFIKRGTTASRKERHHVLRELNRLWSDEATGISEGPLQTILFNIANCLPRYLGDPISCQELLKLVHQILDKTTEPNYPLFSAVLSGIADSLTLESPSKYSKNLARLSLKVSVLVAAKVKAGSAEWKTLVDIQSRLLFVALNTTRRWEEYLTYKIMRKTFSADANGHITKLLQYLTREDALQASAGFIKFISYYALQKGHECVLDCLRKSPELMGVLTHFVRWTFSSKTPAAASFLHLSETGFLRVIDEKTFKDNLLSPMVKSMLRNPEVVLPAVIAVIRGVSVDLSPFCLEIGKQIGTQLHSKVETSRKLSVDAAKYLAQQCSDTAVVDELAVYLFGVLNGSEGKITLATERTDVISGIGNLSAQKRGDLQASADRITSLFTAVVAGEAHEAVAVHAIAMLGLWSAKFTRVPLALQTALKNISSLKSAVIRTAYLGCLSTLLRDQSAEVPADLVPVLSKIVETAAASKVGDVALASEALPAASVLLLLNFSTTKLSTLWSALSDTAKQTFASEKFLSGCSPDAMKFVSLLVERLLVFHYDRLKPDAVRMYIRAMSYSLLRSSQSERRQALQSWKKIVATNRIGMLSEDLVSALKTTLVKLKSADAGTDKSSDGDSTQRAQNFSKNAIAILTFVVECYVELDFPAADKGRLIVECLLISSEPGVASLRPSMWISLLRRFRHDSLFPDKLVADHIDEIWDKLQTEDALSDEALKIAVKTFAGFPTLTTVTKLLANVKKEVSAAEVLAVSLSDVLVFHAPAGVLYDKSVLEAHNEEAAKGNIKRESKAYSYKEQLAEIELRKELEEKKKAKLGGKEAPLTPKQKEVVTKQIQKETVVRQGVAKVYKRIERPFLILDSMIAGNPDCIRSYLSEIIGIVSPLLHVPLTARPACQTWILMSDCVHDHLKNGGIAKSLAFVTLRVLEPACPLPKLWTQESLPKAVARVIHGILSPLEKPEAEEHGLDEDEAEIDVDSTIAVSDICYALPLIRVVVNEAYAKKLGLAESVPVEAFRIVCKVMEMCAGTKTDAVGNGLLDVDEDAIAEMDENNPAFLPLNDVLEMLIEVSESGKVRFESDAGVAIGHFAVAVTRCSTDNSIELESKIIHQLLKLLLSSKSNLRIAAVQALATLTEQVTRFISVPAEQLLLEKRVFIAAHDEEDTKVAEFAMNLFRDLGLRPTEALVLAVVEDITQTKEFLRNSAAAALGAMLPHFPEMTAQVLELLLRKYDQNVEDSKPKLDKFGRPTAESQIDSWPARRGIAAALIRIIPSLGVESHLRDTMSFLLQKPCALRDEKAPVRHDMLQVAIALINQHGKTHVGTLLAKLEEFLVTAPKTADYDVVRQSAIVIMGNLARHLDAGHPKIRPVVHQLLAALSTPSEEVQKAVGGCIAPLVVNIEEDIRQVVPNLLHVLYESESYAHRRGAAYGLAGVFQGLGIMSLKDYDIMVTIMGGLQDKKNAQRRESKFLAFFGAVVMSDTGLIEKEIVKHGSQLIEAVDETKIKFFYRTVKTSDGTVLDDNFPGKEPLELIYGKQFKLEVWEECLKTMELHEVARFTVQRELLSCYALVAKSLRDIAKGKDSSNCGDREHGSGDHHCCGMQNMLKNGLGYADLDEFLKNPEPLIFTLEIVEASEPGSYEKDSWAMDQAEKLKSIPVLHEEGNHLYRKQKYVEAADRYTRALGILEDLMGREQPESDDWKKLDVLRVPILLNYTQCQLILGHYNEAIEHTTTIIEKDPTNVKAWYRRAKAHAMAWNPKEAREDFARAVELDASLSGAVQRDLRKLDEVQRTRDLEDREKMRHLFG